MRVPATTLLGRAVRLVPLTLDHVPELFNVTDGPSLALLASASAEFNQANLTAMVQGLIDNPDRTSFVVTDRLTGVLLGCTSYMSDSPKDLAVEIGTTWLASHAQGTHVNPDMKLAMLAHAFDELGLKRVQLKTDRINERSRAAILKLGAVYEGCLRNHIPKPDGRLRDTVVYSIIDTEWPGVRAGLESRLDTFDATRSASSTDANG